MRKLVMYAVMMKRCMQDNKKEERVFAFEPECPMSNDPHPPRRGREVAKTRSGRGGRLASGMRGK